MRIARALSVRLDVLCFYICPNLWPSLVIPFILNLGLEYGQNHFYGRRKHGSGRKRVVVLSSNPNLLEKFNACHLRSTIVGVALSNYYRVLGWDVVRVNNLGDWGVEWYV